MSARVRVSVFRAGPSPLLATAAMAAGGLSLLFLRPALAVLGSRVWLLAALYVALAALSLAVAVEPARARLASHTVLLVGACAVGLATLATLPHLPSGTGPAALGLNSLAAVAEETFFRRALYGRVAPYGAVPAVAASALLFALVHVPLYGLAAFWVDLGAGLLFSWQRWASGTWRVPAATHVVANLVAVL